MNGKRYRFHISHLCSLWLHLFLGCKVKAICRGQISRSHKKKKKNMAVAGHLCFKNTSCSLNCLGAVLPAWVTVMRYRSSCRKPARLPMSVVDGFIPVTNLESLCQHCLH